MVLSVSTVERLRNAKFALPSRKTTGRYSGCIPFFIKTSVFGPSPDALQLAEELGVGAGLLELLDEKLYLLRGVEGVQDAANLPDPLGLRRLHQQLLLAGARVLDVYRRVDPAVRQLPIEPQLHVARSLELLEDDLIHPAAGLDQRGRQYRQRPAVLDVARRAEELFGRVQRGRVDATGKDAPGGRGREV